MAASDRFSILADKWLLASSGFNSWAGKKWWHDSWWPMTQLGTWFRSLGLQCTSSVRASSAGLWPFLNMPLKILFSCQVAEKQSVKMILFVYLLVTALLTGWWIIDWNLMWSLPWHRCFQTEPHYLLSALLATLYPTTRHTLIVHLIDSENHCKSHYRWWCCDQSPLQMSLSFWWVHWTDRLSPDGWK